MCEIIAELLICLGLGVLALIIPIVVFRKDFEEGD